MLNCFRLTAGCPQVKAAVSSLRSHRSTAAHEFSVLVVDSPLGIHPAALGNLPAAVVIEGIPLRIDNISSAVPVGALRRLESLTGDRVKLRRGTYYRLLLGVY